MPTISAAHKTSSLGYAQTAGGFHATRYASHRGRPFTHLITINFTRLGVPEHEAVSLFQDVRARVARAWRYALSKDQRLGSFDHIHVHENPDGRRNAHWVVHLPEGIPDWFEGKVRRALKTLLKVKHLGDALHVKEIGAPGSVAKYLMKGLDQRYKTHFHMDGWAADQGVVTGRRFGTSRSLGRTARRKNWRRK